VAQSLVGLTPDEVNPYMVSGRLSQTC
jgi:hypothetical protein